ncbi:hypothetical protein [Haliea sp. E17]|uniref:hypothetical protein n=1 Tax=Haliea sp. E17 TaxID=3401576 RepID=UPI003AACE0D4
MPAMPRLALFFAFSALVACDGGNDHHPGTPTVPAEPPRPRLEFISSASPIDLEGINARFAADIPYGEGERNRLDIFLPEDCDESTPLVIHIHGGGFTGGDKSNAYDLFPGHIRELLQSCVAYASINYTLLSVPEAGEGISLSEAQGGVLTSLQDSARALQFLRYYYESLHLDPENVALYGVSAGAGTSLWLGTHDDLALANAEDPVLRESTRVRAVGALATQSTYDLLRWEQVLLPVTEPLQAYLGGTDIPTIAATLGVTNYLLVFLGVETVEDIYSPGNASYRENVDMLGLMDAGDAPVFVKNFRTGFDDPLNMLLHHGLHALAVKARADEVGLESVAYSSDPDFPLTDPSGEGIVSFLSRHIR